MKTVIHNLRKMLLAASCIAFFSGTTHAAIYTAVASGSFSSALTWGGLTPGTLLSTDAIIIPAGINVSLSAVQTFMGTSSLTVNGTLTSATGGALVMTAGTLSGAGTISVDSMAFGLTSGVTFTGAITARRLTSLGATITWRYHRYSGQCYCR